MIVVVIGWIGVVIGWIHVVRIFFSVSFIDIVLHMVFFSYAFFIFLALVTWQPMIVLYYINIFH